MPIPAAVERVGVLPYPTVPEPNLPYPTVPEPSLPHAASKHIDALFRHADINASGERDCTEFL